MSGNKRRDFHREFAEDIYMSLSSPQKSLSSAYFYDEEGNKLFQKITGLPEYYLTRCENSILETHKKEIIRLFSAREGFDLFELGAGDGNKTKILLKALQEAQPNFIYHPIDISQHALQELSANLKRELPDLQISPEQGTYFSVLEEITHFRDRKKVILFLGSNIGNLPPDTSVSFLQKTRVAMGKDDLLFIGFDLKKDPAIILDAYNDSSGVTAAFNKNVLRRINKELHADFDIEAFDHWALYNPHTGEAKSYLVSQKEQEVLIKELNLKVQFRKWESIHTEISRKFDEAEIQEMAEDSGLKIAGCFSDEKDYFRNYIFKKM